MGYRISSNGNDSRTARLCCLSNSIQQQTSKIDAASYCAVGLGDCGAQALVSAHKISTVHALKARSLERQGHRLIGSADLPSLRELNPCVCQAHGHQRSDAHRICYPLKVSWAVAKQMNLRACSCSWWSWASFSNVVTASHCMSLSEARSAPAKRGQLQTNQYLHHQQQKPIDRQVSKGNERQLFMIAIVPPARHPNNKRESTLARSLLSCVHVPCVPECPAVAPAPALSYAFDESHSHSPCWAHPALLCSLSMLLLLFMGPPLISQIERCLAAGSSELSRRSCH
jgi:hypothetical protein